MFVGGTEFFQFYDPRLLPYLPWDNLFCVFAVIRFDDRPAAMRAIVTAPFEVMQVTRRVDFPDDCITVVCFVW